METIQSKNKLSLAIFKELIQNSARLSRIIWADNKRLVVVLAFVFLLISGTPFMQSASRGLLINELVKGSITDERLSYGILLISALVLAYAIPVFLRKIEAYISKKFWFFLEEKFTLLLIKKKGDVDVAMHEDPANNDLFNKIRENGPFRIQNFADRQFFFLQNVVEVLIASAILVFVNWWIFLIIFVSSIPELIVEAKYGKEIWGIWNSKAEIRRKFWDLESHFRFLNKLVELKLFQNIEYFFSGIKDLFRAFQREAIESEKKKLVYQLLSVTLSQAAVGFAIFWFVMEAIKGDILVGTVTFILASIGDFRQALSGFFQNLGRQYQDSLFVTDVFKFIDLKPVIQSRASKIKLDPTRTPEIVFENVSFSYPKATEPVLQNFSLRIPPGEKVAVVGVNGAGKTTFVKLLCRFYDPTSGRITVGGHDLKDIDLESWYYQLGIIFQDYAQYHLIVKDAIAVGRTEKGTDLEKVKAAAKASEADVFIEEFETSYEQMLGTEFTGGIEPSIGQWQKLALARTFYRDPRILILDEPTSSIDAEAEAKIFEKLEELPKDRTVILISHRFSTVRKANKIVIIENGLIKESGTHEELLKLKGTYERLFTLQAKGYQ